MMRRVFVDQTMLTVIFVLLFIAPVPSSIPHKSKVAHTSIPVVKLACLVLQDSIAQSLNTTKRLVKRDITTEMEKRIFVRRDRTYGFEKYFTVDGRKMP